MRIPMFKKIGPEFQCQEGQDQSANVQKIGTEYQCQKDKIGMPMFKKIPAEYQRLKKQGYNSNV